jgi:2-hydroxychromene-2-carboxylate isomerase
MGREVVTPRVELARAVAPDAKQELLSNTERSVARGVFGSPSFFAGDELFFGKDCLRDVEEEIEAQKAR